MIKHALRAAVAAAALTALVAAVAQQAEAPTGFDDLSNGVVDDSTHHADQDALDEVEIVAEGLGPLDNAQSCRECHQNPTSGGVSQIAELLVVHRGQACRFRIPGIFISRVKLV